jgi:hypothetical protein
MASISKRGLNMPLSPIRKLSPLAVKATKEGKYVHQLTQKNERTYTKYKVSK